MKKMPLFGRIGVTFLIHRRYLQKRLLPYKITIQQKHVLDELKKNKFLYPADIADTLFCDRPTATVIINNLQKKGLLNKERDPELKKRVRITITESGKEKINRINKEEKISRLDPLSCLSEKEKKHLEKLMIKVHENVKQMK